ncbi:MAG: sulfurtransferase TusA family protein [Alicyclobacillaceae bacterium]|nr:sulfurtransferase TusA family protein [Alicyclobacillaceae bacterium]
MKEIKVNLTVHCEGLSCPLPVMKTKQAMETVRPGDVIEVVATDRGSIADLKGWAQRTGHQYIGLREEEGRYRHYLRRALPEEEKQEQQFPDTADCEELKEALSREDVRVLDVREPAEYAFGHIPGARNIPLGDLDDRLEELDPSRTWYVICRTGQRSDLACRQLAEKGLRVKNVVPGMIAWDGPIEQDF